MHLEKFDYHFWFLPVPLSVLSVIRNGFLYRRSVQRHLLLNGQLISGVNLFIHCMASIIGVTFFLLSPFDDSGPTCVDEMDELMTLMMAISVRTVDMSTSYQGAHCCNLEAVGSSCVSDVTWLKRLKKRDENNLTVKQIRTSNRALNIARIFIYLQNVWTIMVLVIITQNISCPVFLFLTILFSTTKKKKKPCIGLRDFLLMSGGKSKNL